MRGPGSRDCPAESGRVDARARKGGADLRRPASPSASHGFQQSGSTSSGVSTAPGAGDKSSGSASNTRIVPSLLTGPTGWRARRCGRAARETVGARVDAAERPRPSGAPRNWKSARPRDERGKNPLSWILVIEGRAAVQIRARLHRLDRAGPGCTGPGRTPAARRQVQSLATVNVRTQGAVEVLFGPRRFRFLGRRPGRRPTRPEARGAAAGAEPQGALRLLPPVVPPPPHLPGCLAPHSLYI